ncbi:hypothetical protein VTN77DRAFT_7940 [Rasamsonia byssochlamydoides]|uniref:uncharacterized protein n=1 Tax=Rasamsonia byssochlamydoides TaxID=89139 RepID=UPI0037444421
MIVSTPEPEQICRYPKKQTQRKKTVPFSFLTIKTGNLPKISSGSLEDVQSSSAGSAAPQLQMQSGTATVALWGVEPVAPAVPRRAALSRGFGGPS